MVQKKTFLLSSGDLADTEGKKGYYSFTKTLSKYYNAHNRTLAMGYHLQSIYNSDKKEYSKYLKISNALKNCGDYLHFRDYYTIEERKLLNAYFCKRHLICPLCAIRRGAKQVRAYMEKLEIILQENHNLKAYFITFTIKNGDILNERYRHLTDSFRKLLQARRDSYKPNRRFFEFAYADGGVYSIEFKRGSGSGLWHPHIHCLVLAKHSIDQNKLRSEWKEFTGDSHIVDVQECYGDSIVDSFCEVFKYALKFGDLSLEDNVQAFEDLSGKRLTGAFGLFYGVKVPDSLLDSEIEDADLPFIDRFYTFGCGAYRLVDKIHKDEYTPEYLEYMKKFESAKKDHDYDSMVSLRDRDLNNINKLPNFGRFVLLTEKTAMKKAIKRNALIASTIRKVISDS